MRHQTVVDQEGQPVDHTHCLDTSWGLINPGWVASEELSDAERPDDPERLKH